MQASLLLAATALLSFAAADSTFTKTVGFSYQTTINALPDCGDTIYYSDASCPSGCRLDPLNFGDVKTTAYQCEPTAQATAVAALPIVAHMSCDTAANDFTTTVKPLFGAKWTTCASTTAGTTEYAPAVTLALVTQTP